MYSAIRSMGFAAALGSVLALGGLLGSTSTAQAQDKGNFMVRVGVTGLVFDESFDVTSANVPGDDADVNDVIIPTLTLTYFLTQNLGVELFCCFTKHKVEGAGALAGAGEVADTWVFPPILTANYHFEMGQFKPYVGAGVAFMYFFNEDIKATSPLGQQGITDVEADPAWGFALQAGLDYDLGGGWYANLDVKKVWIDTDVKWSVGSTEVLTGDLTFDPWLITAGIGYRFDLF